MHSTIILCALLCTPLGLQAVAVLPKHGLQAHESKAFLQVEKGNETANPFAPETHHPSDRLMCGITEVVGAHTDKYEDCPSNCPYFAQNRKDTKHCTFVCVPGSECGRWNPNKPIPDSIKNSKTCRGPMVPFCAEPNLGLGDTCKRCSNGYDLWKGDCYFKYWTPLIVGSVILVAILVIVLVWVIDLCCREANNQEAVDKAEEWRSRSKLLEDQGPSQPRRKYSNYTNMCTKNVAGPGMLLHFRFQMFFIIWPLVLALVWTAIACFHNELFILGTRKFGTPRHNCILVAWGYETQQRLMWTKVLFLVIAYFFSFVTFLLFGVSQLRTYQKLDSQEKTMKDFAVELTGLPELPGRAEVEQDIQKAVEKAFPNQKIVGVSVAWNYADVEEQIDQACRRDLVAREAEVTGVQPVNLANEPDPTENMNGVHKWLYQKEKDLFGPDEEEDVDVKQLLLELKSSENAYVVFATEEEKDAVLTNAIPIKFDASKYGFEEVELEVMQVDNEPANINWNNFGDSSHGAMMGRFLKGFFTVYVPALLIWFFGFYVPYAISLYYFNYDNGAELPGYYAGIFTIVICGGNATMYVVCDVCCDMIGFRYKDTKQVTYMLMYLVACMINVFLDMIVTYYTALKIMVGLDFRTYHGVRLSEIDTFTEQFETYAMQRSLGENTYRYAWPSTFFLCFVLEPFVTILFPYWIGRVVIRTHREVQGACAEAYLMAFEFDLGRYADILLNVFLGILIFYFPGGYIWTLFFAMSFSHCFIYCFDHYRVLNTIPYIKIVSNAVDWWAQVMMAGCCATIMMCLVMKANCESYTNYCLQDVSLIAACGVAGLIHFIVHLLLLVYLVPMMGHDLENDNEGMSFESAAKDEARTWFSVNPIHCLRSQYIHQDKPHCHLAMWGKEHLLEMNPKINCYFTCVAAEKEDYGNDLRKSFADLKASFSKPAEEKDTSADAGK